MDSLPTFRTTPGGSRVFMSEDYHKHIKITGPDKLEIFGHEVKVKSDAAIDAECQWWVCARVIPGEKKPIESAQEDFCTQCNCAIWFDPRPVI